MEPVKKYYFNRRFRIDTGIRLEQNLPNHAGYQLNDLIVRIHNWYDKSDPTEFQEGLNNVSYGILVDIEDGDQRLSSISDKPYRILKSATSDNDRKDRESFDNRYKAAGTPIYNETHGAYSDGLYLISIPVPESCGTSPEQIRQAQENIIRNYINDMRSEWEKLLRRMRSEQYLPRSEFDNFARNLASEEPHGRWELVRGFINNAIREQGNGGPVSHFKTFPEWFCDQELVPVDRSIPLDKNRVETLLEKLAMPLEEGRVYKVEVDWALPYILCTSDSDYLISASEYNGTAFPEGAFGDGPAREFNISPDRYYPFNNFLHQYTGKAQLTVTGSKKTYALNPTGYTLLSVLMHYIVNIEYLQHQNYEALRPYYNYVTRLAQIKARLCGKDGKGPFVGKSMEEIRKKIIDLEKQGYEYTELPDSNPFNFTKNPHVENPAEQEEHIRQLLLGIGDIDKLEQLFQAIIQTENNAKNGRNRIRTNSIDRYIDLMRNLMGLLRGKNKFWDQAFDSVWRFDTNIFGPILFLHKSHLHFARSSQSGVIYNRFFKKLIFESHNFTAHGKREERQNKLRRMGAGYRYCNWFWKFDSYIVTLYLNNLEHHLNQLTENFDTNSGADPVIDEFERMLSYLYPDFENILPGFHEFINSIREIAQNPDILNKPGRQARKLKEFLARNRDDPSIKQLEDKIREVRQESLKKGAEMGNAASLMGNVNFSAAAAVLNVYSIILTANAHELDIDNFSGMRLAGMAVQGASTVGQLASSFDRGTAFYNKLGHRSFNYFKFLQGAKAAAGIAKYCTFTSWLGVGFCGVNAYESSVAGDYKDAILMTVAGVGEAMAIVAVGTMTNVFGAIVGVAFAITGPILSYYANDINNNKLWAGETEEFIRQALTDGIFENGMDNFSAFKKDHTASNHSISLPPFIIYTLLPHGLIILASITSQKDEYQYEGRTVYHCGSSFERLRFVENINRDGAKKQIFKLIKRSETFLKDWDVGDLYDLKITHLQGLDVKLWDLRN